MSRLDVNVRDFAERLTVLERLVDGIDDVPLEFQKVVGELVMLRLFALLEEHIRGVCVKIACGARYVDGTRPALIKRAANRVAAMSQMRTLNRPKNLDLSWTTCKAIKKNLEFSIAPA